jgi:hypothetical protein
MALHGKRLAVGGWWVEAEFSRKLERERDLMCEERDMYRRERDIAIVQKGYADQARAEASIEISSLLHLCEVNGLRDHGTVQRIAAKYPANARAMTPATDQDHGK